MSMLARIQAELQAALLGGDVQRMVATAGCSGVIGAQTYAHAYRARLCEVLELDFPALRALLGDDAFANLALRYIAVRPSYSRSLRWYGGEFAAFLASLTEVAGRAWLAELARFEWALGEAFDAIDEPRLDAATLHDLAPAEWGTLRLRRARHVRVLRLGWNVPAIQAAAVSGRAPPAAEHDERAWLIWRQDQRVRFKPLAEDAARALADAAEDREFARLCAHFSDFPRPAQRAVEVLHEWLALGLVAAPTVSTESVELPWRETARRADR
jgi:hypothetical protein